MHPPLVELHCCFTVLSHAQLVSFTDLGLRFYRFDPTTKLSPYHKSHHLTCCQISELADQQWPVLYNVLLIITKKEIIPKESTECKQQVKVVPVSVILHLGSSSVGWVRLMFSYSLLSGRTKVRVGVPLLQCIKLLSGGFSCFTILFLQENKLMSWHRKIDVNILSGEAEGKMAMMKFCAIFQISI